MPGASVSWAYMRIMLPGCEAGAEEPPPLAARAAAAARRARRTAAVLGRLASASDCVRQGPVEIVAVRAVLRRAGGAH
jgi:hypothetical protein